MCKLQSPLAPLALVVLAAVLFVPSAAAQKEPANVATVSIGGDRVDWRLAVDYERLTLVIIGPDGFVDRQELTAGQTPSLGLFDANGGRLPDGLYRYELRLLPTRVPGRGDSPPAPVQRGTLMVRDGSFDIPAQPAGSQVVESAVPLASPARRITANDTVVPDDLVVQGNACIGATCANGEPDSNSLILKNSTPRIFFHDPAADCTCFPARNWTLAANLNTQDRFSLRDDLSGSIPF
ncbi:MAG TPA: hypothetical protein VFS60_13790, partial [Thermoanaerobaculia bacterium]|nr:hypothetical protein [Thermoanaerobaculia bacterium]